MSLPTPEGTPAASSRPPLPTPPPPVQKAAAPQTQHQRPSQAPPSIGMEDLPVEMTRDLPGRARSVMICSIYPRALESQPFAHGGRGRVVYQIAAGSLESPAYLEVFNTFQMVQNPYQDSEASQLIPKAVDARQFAHDDLVGYWANNFLNGKVGRIGVFICKGSQATSQELEEAKLQQQAFMLEQVRIADEKWFGGERGFPLTEARRAAKWLKDTDAKKHPWLSEVVYDSTRKCPKCAEQVATESSYCRGCQTSVAQFLLDRGRPAPHDWPVVAEEMEYLRKKGA